MLLMLLMPVCISCLFLLVLAVYVLYGFYGLKILGWLLLYVIAGNIVIHIAEKRQDNKKKQKGC